MTASRALIVGVGYTGRRLIERLDNGVGLSRTAGPGTLPLDLDAESDLPIDVEENDAIVYTVPPDPDHDADVRLERLTARLATAPKRFVYLSTTGVYGNHDGGRVDESTPPSPATDRARRRLAAEQLLEEWSAGHGTDLVILRVPGIYGPGRLGLERLEAGQPLIADDEAGPGNRIHVDDLVACCLAALDEAAPAGVYNVGDGDHRSSTWFSKEVARQAGLSPPATISRADALDRASEMRRSFLMESRRADVSRMREALKPSLRYTDPAAGIAASLAAGE